jgi:hypothetical protein
MKHEGNVSDLPLVLVVEDEYELQGLVEETLRKAASRPPSSPPERRR